MDNVIKSPFDDPTTIKLNPEILNKDPAIQGECPLKVQTCPYLVSNFLSEELYGCQRWMKIFSEPINSNLIQNILYSASFHLSVEIKLGNHSLSKCTLHHCNPH